MSNISYRSLKPEDLDRVVEIDVTVGGRSRQGFFEKRLAAAQAKPDDFFTCAAMDGDKLVGFLFSRVQQGEFGGTQRVAIIDIAGVDPAAQGKGVGKGLQDGLETRLKKAGITNLRTQVEWTDGDLVGYFAAMGFSLSPRTIIERDCSALEEEVEVDIDRPVDAGWEDHSDSNGDDFAALSRDRVLVRSMTEEDLASVTRIDGKLTGQDRSAYYQSKMAEVMGETGIRVSQIAEMDGAVVGYVMARVDYGEFGRAEPAAVMDTIGVHPAYANDGIGHALLSQLLANLSTLRVDTIRTQVSWKNFALLKFLGDCGFAPSQRLVLAKEF